MLGIGTSGKLRRAGVEGGGGESSGGTVVTHF